MNRAAADAAGLLPRQCIEAGQIDVWCLPVDEASVPLAELHGVLDPEEQARAARFIGADHRDRFVRAHALMRIILSAYLDSRPEALRFGSGAHGKPYLIGAETLSFNLSHSHGLAALAVGRGMVLGVDVERCRALTDRDGLIGRFFSTTEQASYLALPEAERDEGFFRLWTRKEAYIKALGEGLSCPLDSFTVSIGARAAILAPVLPGWSLHHFEPAEGYLGALAVDAVAPTVLWPRLGP
jgi:4'-phosphopantetheinyl transferase